MSNDDKNKKQHWRIVVFVISALFIVFMWIKNNIVVIYTAMPKKQVATLIATTIAVLLIKVGAIAGTVFLAN